MPDLHDVIPTPTPITLGGRVFWASELRLADVAKIQRWLDLVGPAPGKVATPQADDGPTGADRPLRDGIDDRWPGGTGNAKADALVRTKGGQVLLIACSLRREHPELSAQHIEVLHAAATRAEFARLVEVAWGEDCWRRMAALIAGPCDGVEGHGLDWVALSRGHAANYRNKPPFPELTVAQFLATRLAHGRRGDPIHRRLFFADEAADRSSQGETSS